MATQLCTPNEFAPFHRIYHTIYQQNVSMWMKNIDDNTEVLLPHNLLSSVKYHHLDVARLF